MSPVEPESVLASLLEQSACRHVISRYSAAVDWADRDALERTFWPDARFDFGPPFFVGSGAAGIDFLMAGVNASISRTHALGDTWLEVDKREARGETPAVNVWISRNPDGSISRYLFTARYLWNLEKRNDEWRVIALKVLITTAQCTPYDLNAQPPGFQLREGLGVEHPDYPGPHS